jgi:hypothetical protein
VTSIRDLLHEYQPHGETESADVARVRALADRTPDPYQRSLPLHVTGSALIVHPDSGRVLLRWHPRQQAWLRSAGTATRARTTRSASRAARRARRPA